MHAAPLYEERKAIVNGTKDVPAPKEEEGATEANEDEEGPVPPGIPEFWLGVLRANRVIGESVSCLQCQIRQSASQNLEAFVQCDTLSIARDTSRMPVSCHSLLPVYM